jgi:outer membrane lipoprotein-sorting protein
LQGGVSTSYITVADQQNVWKYDSLQNSVQITEGPMEPGDLAVSGASSLKNALQKASTCYNPRLAGEEQVAGRAAYVVEMGASTCPSASMPDTNGPLTFWLDKETYFVLKSTLRDTAGTQTIATTEVSSIVYNQGVDDSIFIFTPPAGATVADTRPRPTVDSQAFAEQLGALAKQADFPLFAPSFIPGDLRALQPQLDIKNGLSIEYTAPGEAQANSTAGQGSVSITERKATYAMVTRWTDQADLVPVSGSRAWLQRGSGNSDEKPSVLVLRDGTFVAITGASSEDLMKVASSLVPVPGGHAPIADPIPPTLSEVRGTVSFPVFVPTDLPAGFVADPPLGGEQPEDRVEISYHTPDGAPALLVMNGPAGCCLDAGGLSTGTSEAVQLANGTNAHYLPGVPESGGPILWWEQDGSYVALSGPAQTRESLLQIASSMSKTAGLDR